MGGVHVDVPVDTLARVPLLVLALGVQGQQPVAAVLVFPGEPSRARGGDIPGTRLGADGVAIVAGHDGNLLPVGELRTEHVLADLACRGEREAAGEQPAGGDLVGGEPGPAVLGELGFGRGGRGRADDGAHFLAPEPVRDPDDGGLGDARVAGQDGFDLARVDVLAAADDHLLDPARDAAVAALVHGAEVAGVQPAARVDRRAGGLRVAEVARHDVVAAGADLADGPAGHGLAGGHVGDLDLGVRQRPAERLRPVGGRVADPGQRDRAAGLGLRERGHERDPEGRLDLPHQLRRHDRAAGQGVPQAGQVALRAARVSQQRGQHRGHAPDAAATVGLDELELQPGIEAGHEHVRAEGLRQSEGHQPAARHVEERHRVDRGLPGPHADGVGGQARVVSQAPVGEHRGLGAAGGARGVQDLCGAGGIDLRQALAVPRRAEAVPLAERDHLA